MPHFVMICRDGADGMARRAEVRPAHLDHVAAAGDAVEIAGALKDDAGNPVGSLFVVEMEDAAAVAAFADADPYHRNGVFASREILPFNKVIDTLSPPQK